MTPKQKRAISEKASKKALGANDTTPRTSAKNVGQNPGRGRKIAMFNDILKAYIKGDSVEKMAETFGVTISTMESKAPQLKLAALELGLWQTTPESEEKVTPDGKDTNSGMVAGPVTPHKPPGTNTVPAGTPSEQESEESTKGDGGVVSSPGSRQESSEESGEKEDLPEHLQLGCRETAKKGRIPSRWM